MKNNRPTLVDFRISLLRRGDDMRNFCKRIAEPHGHNPESLRVYVRRYLNGRTINTDMGRLVEKAVTGYMNRQTTQ